VHVRVGQPVALQARRGEIGDEYVDPAGEFVDQGLALGVLEVHADAALAAVVELIGRVYELVAGQRGE